MIDFGEGLKKMFSLATSGDIRITKDILPSIHQKLKSISQTGIQNKTIKYGIKTGLNALKLSYSSNKKNDSMLKKEKNQNSITHIVKLFPIIKQVRGIFDELLKKTKEKLNKILSKKNKNNYLNFQI